MLSARPRRLMTASLLLAAGLSLSACGTGGDAQTNAVYQPAIGANLRSGDVQLYNALLVSNDDDTYTLSAGLLNKTKQPEQLTGASITPLDGGAPATAEPSSTVEIPSDRLLTIGSEGEIVLSASDLVAGKYVKLTLTFAGAGDVSIEAPVVERGEEGVYDAVAETEGGAAAEEKAAEEEAAAGPNEVASQGAEGAAE
ncbi:hypothetical protein ASD11_01790 [Aeromicrobium sp. Root495]|uniref:hypothetical protein n=1 Tax=Aeromicrobium sp. Root495 TaxID=1736550 RepID=UPI0006FD0494|nr:hypothetical protein [Aeromicrobium sp. Root495]KQY58422.1 hypothetical protein ASD11_01790 [Aeromicrobium sp. Root495]